MTKTSSFFTPKLMHDAQFSAVSFITMIFILWHYALIMRQLLFDPYMELTVIFVHGLLFVLNLAVSGYVLLYVVYPYIYREELKEDKKGENKSE